MTNRAHLRSISRARRARALFAALAIAVFGSAHRAAAADEVERPVVRVSGAATVSAPADVATLSVAVVSEDRTSARAVADNATASTAVIDALRKLLGKEATISTRDYSVGPQYDYGKTSPGAPVLRGYVVRNTVLVRTAALAKIGLAIDAAAAAGANEVQSIVFGVEDDEELRLAALAGATKDARAKADEVARALGVKLGAVVSLAESGLSVEPVRMQRADFAEAKASTPIEAGGVEFHAGVVLTVAIGD